MSKRNLIILSLLFLIASNSFSQTNSLSISQCYELARKNYPLIKQRELIVQSKEFNIANVRSGYLPQITINGQASYQSAVTQVPITFPGLDIKPLSKDQYKIYADINQNLFDGNNIKNQSRIQETSAQVEEQKLEVELYKINDRINQIFFGVLMMDEQAKQIELVRKDLQSSITKVEASIANGVAFKTNADILQAELLKTEQRIIETRVNRKAFLEMLSLFINLQLNDQAVLEKPVSVDAMMDADIKRPELSLYNFQSELLGSQYQLTNTKVLPKASLFFQGGYGRPGLNALLNEFSTYYIGGLRMSWNIGGYYNLNRDKQLLDVNVQTLNAQKEAFLFNTKVTLKQQSNEITKLQELIAVDRKIIELRARIKSTAKAQLDNGVITANDYLRELNAEDQANENLIFHDIQLLMNQYGYKTTSGN
jgi:outer membrane protein TolC